MVQVELATFHCQATKLGHSCLFDDRWTILPVIWLESWRGFSSFRHELLRQRVSRRSKSIPRFFVELLAECTAMQRSAWFLWRWHCALSIVLMTTKKRSNHLDLLEKACCVLFYESGESELSETSSWFLEGLLNFDQNAPQFDLLWVSCLWHTQTIALVKHCALDQTNKNCWQLHSCWGVVGDVTSTLFSLTIRCSSPECDWAHTCAKLTSTNDNL